MGEESRFAAALVHGRPAEFSLKIAFGALGGVLLELLEPLDDQSPHAAFLATREEYTRQLLANTPSIEAALGGIAVAGE